MMHTDRTFSEAVRRAVQEAERGTSAELIVVVAARSGSYLDVAGALGGVAALSALLVALFAPTTFHPVAIAVDIPLVFAVVTWLANRTPGLLRALVRGARARGQVERAAASHFLSEAAHGTRGRTGLLIYLSMLEQRVALVPDLGLAAHVPPGLWSDERFGEVELVRGITEIGSILRERLPADGLDVNESPDAPRILR